jgi:hypothetical protein
MKLSRFTVSQAAGAVLTEVQEQNLVGRRDERSSRDRYRGS